MQNSRRFYRKASQINSVQTQPRKRRRKSARRLQLGRASHQLLQIKADVTHHTFSGNMFVEYFSDIETHAQQVAQAIVPIIGIASDDQRRTWRRRTAHGLDQGRSLTSPVATEKTQMHDIAMNIGDAGFQHAMQDAACLIGMLEKILIALQDNFQNGSAIH